MPDPKTVGAGWRVPAFTLALTVLVLTACAPTKTQTTLQAGAAESLPRPDRVLVYTFAVSPDEVRLDSGLSAEVAQALSGTPRTEQEQQVGRAVANTIATRLVADIQKMGLPATRAEGPPPAGNDVLIRGQLVSIDQGNRTERVAIGLGAGRSDVEARAQVYESVAGTTVPVETITGTAKSGYMPGAAETLGVGAVTGHLLVSAAVTAGSHVAGETLSADVDSEANRLADKLSDQLRSLFVAKGWIAANAGS